MSHRGASSVSGRENRELKSSRVGSGFLVAVMATLMLGACADEAAPGYPAGPYGSAVGSTLDNYTLVDLEGASVSVDDLRTTPVALFYLTATWCFTCGPETAWLNEQLPSRPEVSANAIVFQNRDYAAPGPEDGVYFRDTNEPVFPVLVDSAQEFSGDVTPDVIPLNLVVRTDTMEIVHRSFGFDPDTLDAALRTALGE